MMIRSRAPLRLGFAGGGTDVSPYCDQFGGAVLNATIDLYAYCTIEESAGGEICFSANDLGQTVSIAAADQVPLDGALGLHRGVYNRIVKEFNDGRPLAVTVTTSCDAPPGSGLGSSSTLVTAIVQAYVELLNLPLGEYEIARLAYEIERHDLKLHGGRQDQYAAVFGGFNFMEFDSPERVLVNPLRVKSWIISELESSLVLFYTGKSRESAAIINQQSENVKLHNQAAIEAMHRGKQEAYHMKEALLRGEIHRFGEVLDQAWRVKKQMASGISNPRIERYYQTAISAGAYCGKVSGAGGGGFMMFLVDAKDRLNVIDSLSALKEGQVFNCHFSSSGAESWRIR